MTTIVEKEYLRKADEYIYNWNLLDRIKIPLIWRVIFPVGFYLKMNILYRKAILTNEYSQFIEKAKDIHRQEAIALDK